MKSYVSLLLFLTLMGCEKRTTRKFFRKSGELLSEIQFNKEGRKDGELREYYKTGELKTLEFYKNGILVDTTRGFYKNGLLSTKIYSFEGNNIYEKYHGNGNLMSKGQIIDTILKGWWSFYDFHGNLERKVEYIDKSADSTIKNGMYPNQIIYYDEKGNILIEKSNFFKIFVPDTIRLGKVTFGEIDLVPQISKESDFHMVYFWHNINGISSEIDSTYGKNFENAKFWILPKKAGKCKLKGYIYEKGVSFKSNEIDTSLMDVIQKSKKLFFEKELHLKDSL